MANKIYSSHVFFRYRYSLVLDGGDRFGSQVRWPLHYLTVLLAINFLFLVKNVRERHLTIKPVIGVFKEEEEAFELITWLSWIIPLLLTIFSLLELVMVFVYQKYLHPWACIFAEENTNSQVSSCFSYISIFSNLFMIFFKPK